jgi:hypothetical protein
MQATDAGLMLFWEVPHLQDMVVGASFGTH